MVIGRERMRRPVAWYTAFAIAAETPMIPISPSPLIPIGLNLSGCPMKLSRETRSCSQGASGFDPRTTGANADSDLENASGRCNRLVDKCLGGDEITGVFV
jgi:hypothetical protein